MTVVVGILGKDRVLMASDSRVSLGHYASSLQDGGKIFKPKGYNDVIVGYAGAFRGAQLIRHNELFVRWLKDDTTERLKTEEIDMEYLVNDLSGIVGELIYGDYPKSDKHQNPPTVIFILGVKNKLYSIHSDYSVIQFREDYIAIGSGRDIASGSLHTTVGEKPEVRLYKALKASAYHDVGVAGPFFMIDTKTDKVVELTEDLLKNKE